MKTGIAIRIVFLISGAFGLLGAAIAETTNGKGLKAQEIMKVLKAELGKIEDCYESQLKQNPSLAGKVSVKYVVGSRGTVRSCGVEENSTKSKPLGTCICSEIIKWKFPKPRGGEDVTVNYPFTFSPDGKASD